MMLFSQKSLKLLGFCMSKLLGRCPLLRFYLAGIHKYYHLERSYKCLYLRHSKVKNNKPQGHATFRTKFYTLKQF